MLKTCRGMMPGLQILLFLSYQRKSNSEGKITAAPPLPKIRVNFLSTNSPKIVKHTQPILLCTFNLGRVSTLSFKITYQTKYFQAIDIDAIKVRENCSKLTFINLSRIVNPLQ